LAIRANLLSLNEISSKRQALCTLLLRGIPEAYFP
jgi:hypothetical protein